MLPGLYEKGSGLSNFGDWPQATHILKQFVQDRPVQATGNEMQTCCAVVYFNQAAKINFYRAE